MKIFNLFIIQGKEREVGDGYYLYRWLKIINSKSEDIMRFMPKFLR